MLEQLIISLLTARNQLAGGCNAKEQHRVLVNRVDTSNPDWPEKPASQ